MTLAEGMRVDLPMFSTDMVPRSRIYSRAHVGAKTTGRRLHLGGELPPPMQPLRRLTVHRNGRIFFVPVGDVDWIEAAGSYVRVHAGARTHLLRDSIKRLEAHVDPQAFARIHRSAMVRIDRIQALRPLFHGEYEVQLTTGAMLKLSRSYRATLDAILAG